MNNNNLFCNTAKKNCICSCGISASNHNNCFPPVKHSITRSTVCNTSSYKLCFLVNTKFSWISSGSNNNSFSEKCSICCFYFLWICRKIYPDNFGIFTFCTKAFRLFGKVAVVEGVESLTGAPVRATDLRAGAALIIAGLIANGVTEVEEIRHIERGYEDVAAKFRGLGAKMTKVDDRDGKAVLSIG